jgi:hypothetical protein
MPDAFWQELVDSFEGLDSYNAGLEEEDQITQVKFARMGVIDMLKRRVRRRRERLARRGVVPVTDELTIT